MARIPGCLRQLLAIIAWLMLCGGAAGSVATLCGWRLVHGGEPAGFLESLAQCGAVAVIGALVLWMIRAGKELAIQAENRRLWEHDRKDFLKAMKEFGTGSERSDRS